MKIRILVPDSGSGGARNVGDEVDVDAKEGARLIEAGRAEIVAASRQSKVEKAVK